MTANLATASYILEHSDNPKAAHCLYKAILNMTAEELQTFHEYLATGSYIPSSGGVPQVLHAEEGDSL